MDTVEGSLFYIGKRQRYRKDVSDFPEKERQNGKKAGIGRSQALHFLRRLREYLSEECDSRMEGAFREVEESLCIGCTLCARVCPAGCIDMRERSAK